MFELFEKKDLNPFILYRSKRWDTKDDTHLYHNSSVLIQKMSEPWELSSLTRVQERCNIFGYSFVLQTSQSDFEPKANPCGAGDFLLMSKEMWLAVGGFTEYPGNPNIDAVFLAKIMKLIPGYARSFIRYSTLHQWHPKKNVLRAALNDHTDIMAEYACKGESKLLGQYDNPEKWGFSDEVFEEIVK